VRRRRRATDMSHLVDPDPDYPSDSEEGEGEEEGVVASAGEYMEVYRILN
jgi:hypothetical protein